jgi:hypothetical protein
MNYFTNVVSELMAGTGQLNASLLLANVPARLTVTLMTLSGAIEKLTSSTVPNWSASRGILTRG